MSARHQSQILDAIRRIPLGPRLKVAAVAAPLGLALAVGLQRGASPDGGQAGSEALARVAAMAFEREGLQLRGEVRLVALDALTVEGATTCAAVAEVVPRGGRAADLARVTVTRAPGGAPVRVGPVFNLTSTDEADERVEALDGAVVWLSVRLDGQVTGLVALDFDGEDPALVAQWSGLDRRKNRVSNWQETGQGAGLGRQRLTLPEPLANLGVEPKGQRRYTLTDGARPLWTVTLAPRLGAEPGIEPIGAVATVPEVGLQLKGQRPHLGWLVDTVRDLSWVGPTKIARLEDIAFIALDALKRGREAALGPEPVEAPLLAADPVPGQEPGVDLAQIPTATGQGGRWRPSGERREARLWPPKPGKPVFSEPGPGEGQWVPMTRLVKPAADQGVLFYQSWLRPDTGRGFALVSVTAWDPSRVALHTVAGTREPESQTGLKGTGQIPRRADTTPRVVAAFNGGFQSKHGKYGMVTEEGVIAPPLGTAATVAMTKDGRALMGDWPAGGPRPSPWFPPPGVETPAWVGGMRQNLESLVDGGRFNPSGRKKKWGSTAGSTASGVYTVRTGMCLLEGGAMAYFFGTSVSAEMLGEAMLAFHCRYGMHLDMNAGHSGFEFYHIKDVEGTDFEAARMIQKMWHMNYPRYIKRDARDFFYLTLRELPVERLERLTGLSWRHPALDDARGWEPARHATPPGEPARVLLSEVTLAGGEAHTWLVRLPRGDHGARGGVHGALAEGAALPSQPSTVALINHDAPPRATHHLDLRPGRLGALLPEAVGADSVPVVALALEGRTQPEGELGGAGATLIGVSDEDVVLAGVGADQVAALRDWMVGHGFGTVVALPRSEDADMALRLMSAEGEEAYRGGPVRRDRALLRLDLPPDVPWTGRVEERVQSPPGLDIDAP